MRFLVLTEQWFPDYHGGSARVVAETAFGLARLGHHVDVIAPAIRGEPAQAAVEGVRLHRVLRRRAFPRTFTDPLMTRRALRAFRLDDYDHILVHHATVGAGLPHVAPPVTYVFHASPALELQHRREQGLSLRDAAASRVLEPVLRALERRALSRSTQVLVLSSFSLGLLKSTVPDLAVRACNVGGGVRTSEFLPASDRSAVRAALGVADGDQVLLTVRRLVPRMGVDNLIAAFAEVAEEFPHLRLVVVGDGEMRPILEQQASAAGVAGRVLFLGRVPDEAIMAWYQAADLFVLPTVAYEGFGIVTAEALSSGLPVLGTPVGATPEILGAVAPELVARSASANDLADSLRLLLPTLDADLRRKVREFAARSLDWDEVVVRWAAAIASPDGILDREE